MRRNATRRAFSAAAALLAAWTISAAVGLAQEAQDLAGAEPHADRPELIVNGEQVMKSEVDAAIAAMNLPRYKQLAQRAELLHRATRQLLTEAYAEKRKLPVDEVAFQKSVKQLRTRMAMAKLIADMTAAEKIRSFMEANPHLFDGTRVKVSQIMIRSHVYESSVDQLAARKKLEDISRQIASGELSFAEAAEKYSDDPSRVGGGDMGWFDITGASDMGFAYHSFNTLKGSVSPILRTNAGWHLILVIDKALGNGQPQEWLDPGSQRRMPPEALAARLIVNEIDQDILLSPIKDSSVAYHPVQDEQEDLLP